MSGPSVPVLRADGRAGIYSDRHERRIASISNGPTFGDDIALAKHIVRAMNSHAALVAALRPLLEHARQPCKVPAVLAAAIAAAEAALAEEPAP